MENPSWFNWLVGSVLFLQGIWPLFTRKTIPELLAKWRNLPMTEANQLRETNGPGKLWKFLHVISLGIGVSVLALLVFPHLQPNQDFWNPDYEIVDSHHYANELVEIDGKRFINCTFNNVTLMFRGTANFSFVKPKWKGELSFRTSNDAAHAHAVFSAYIKDMKSHEVIKEGEVDESGSFTPLPELLDKATQNGNR